MPEVTEQKARFKEDLERQARQLAAERERIEAGLRESEDTIQATNQELDVLRGDVQNASQTINTAYKWLDRVAWMMPIGTIVAYYGTYFLVLGLPLDALALGGLGVAIPVALVMRLVMVAVAMQLQTRNVSMLPF